MVHWPGWAAPSLTTLNKIGAYLKKDLRLLITQKS